MKKIYVISIILDTKKKLYLQEEFRSDIFSILGHSYYFGSISGCKKFSSLVAAKQCLRDMRSHSCGSAATIEIF